MAGIESIEAGVNVNIFLWRFCVLLLALLTFLAPKPCLECI